jgi:hypothetical protein
MPWSTYIFHTRCMYLYLIGLHVYLLHMEFNHRKSISTITKTTLISPYI